MVSVNAQEPLREVDRLLRRTEKFEDCLRAILEQGAESARELPGDVRVEVEGNNGSLIAEGEGVAFAEFGTGVYANNYERATYNIDVRPGSWSENHQNQFGHVHGPDNDFPGWWFGHTWISQGTQPILGMYHAGQNIEEHMGEVASNFYRGYNG